MCGTLCEIDLVWGQIGYLAGLSFAEDEVLNSMETGQVLAVCNGVIDECCIVVVGCRVVFSHVFLKLGLVERPCIGVWVE